MGPRYTHTDREGEGEGEGERERERVHRICTVYGSKRRCSYNRQSTDALFARFNSPRSVLKFTMIRSLRRQNVVASSVAMKRIEDDSLFLKFFTLVRSYSLLQVLRNEHVTVHVTN